MANQQNLTVTVTRRRIREARAQLEAAHARGLRLGGLAVEAEATRRAPVDKGVLRGSANTQVLASPGNIEVSVSFNTPYAEKQHEEQMTHPKGGESKYLTNALNAKIPDVVELCKREVAREL